MPPHIQLPNLDIRKATLALSLPSSTTRVDKICKRCESEAVKVWLESVCTKNHNGQTLTVKSPSGQWWRGCPHHSAETHLKIGPARLGLATEESVTSSPGRSSCKENIKWAKQPVAPGQQPMAPGQQLVPPPQRAAHPSQADLRAAPHRRAPVAGRAGGRGGAGCGPDSPRRVRRALHWHVRLLSLTSGASLQSCS